MSGRSDWTERAACRGTYPDTWFSTDPTTVKALLRVCATCPVAEACLRDALTIETSAEYIYGVRGGLTVGQRRAMVAAQNGTTSDPRCGTYAGYRAHTRLGSEPCLPCRDAMREYNRTYSERRREAAALRQMLANIDQEEAA